MDARDIKRKKGKPTAVGNLKNSAASLDDFESMPTLYAF